MVWPLDLYLILGVVLAEALICLACYLANGTPSEERNSWKVGREEDEA